MTFMRVAIYDPAPYRNEYASKLFFASMRQYAAANGIQCRNIESLLEAERGEVLVILTDHLNTDLILMLKNNGTKIVGFNVTDSSYIAQSIRYSDALSLVDLIFMVSGVQNTNAGSEIAVDSKFRVTLVDKPFLDPASWQIFDYLRRAGRLQSLPYAPWAPIPEATREPFNRRSQKVILRGGGHARRFLLALFLHVIDKLDPNSGFVLFPYFAEDMNPQFRYCDACRSAYRHDRWANRRLADLEHCNSPAMVNGELTMADLGQWNNRCPNSFFWMAEQFARYHGSVDMKLVEDMLNARWLEPKEHMAAMSRITFTSDLKWVQSIYKPQRFWEAAAAGCINVLPMRTMAQDYFPHTVAGHHYLVYEETFKNLELAFSIDESSYNEMAGDCRRLYETWIAPSIFGMNTNLLERIFGEMRKL